MVLMVVLIVCGETAGGMRRGNRRAVGPEGGPGDGCGLVGASGATEFIWWGLEAQSAPRKYSDVVKVCIKASLWRPFCAFPFSTP